MTFLDTIDKTVYSIRADGLFAKKGDLKGAEKANINGINMPKSYCEAKTFFNQEAHIYFFLSKIYDGEKHI